MRLYAAAILALTILTPASAHALDRILVVGDSHTAFTFGRTLDSRLREIPNAKVTTVGSCGSSTQHWIDQSFVTQCGQWERDENGTERYLDGAGTPHLDTLLQKDPDWVVIALGSNNLMADANEARIETEIRAMIQASTARGGRCIWVGPPDMRIPDRERVAAFYRVLRRVAGQTGTQCRVIDSRDDTLYPPRISDGTHYKGVLKPVAISWGRSVASKIQTIVQTPARIPHTGVEPLHRDRGAGAHGAE